MVNVSKNRDGYDNAVELVLNNGRGIVFWTATDVIGFAETRLRAEIEDKRGVLVRTFEGVNVEEVEQFAIALMRVCENYRQKIALSNLLSTFVHIEGR